MKKTLRQALTVAGVAVVMGCMLALVGCGGSSSSSSDGSSGGDSALSGSISENGSTSMEKVMGSLNEAFMQDNPGVSITYDATGSGTGIESAKNNSADLGLASRALKSDEADGLQETTIALDGIAVVVNANNGVDNLSLEQVSKIFKGEITNWKEVGGEDLAISTIGRENSSGTRDGFESATDTKDACKLEQELTSTGAVLTAVSSSPNAIGYGSLASVESQSGIKAVKVDGVECSEATILDGTYPIQRPFNIITNTGSELSPQAQAFLDFCTSPAAAQLISDAGAVPVN